ncbi:hypothetical protein A2U01_0016196, partial [Trifolium medium]|nr:hypothetical protein [Trifolium medium]
HDINNMTLSYDADEGQSPTCQFPFDSLACCNNHHGNSINGSFLHPSLRFSQFGSHHASTRRRNYYTRKHAMKMALIIRNKVSACIDTVTSL